MNGKGSQGALRVSSAVIIEDLDGNEGGLLGYTVRCAAESTGNMGAVTGSIRVVAVREVLSKDSSALEVLDLSGQS